ncbi:MAG TPA: class I SAM-dependent methyltransferase [Candidatus Binatia bacterium]|nr:class I SAM-dependent methyltransferase [Candidatus Binatia bacterium]
MPEEKRDSRSDPLFRTQKRPILNIWDQMQRLQTDFALAQELTFYYTSPQWHAAKKVLDLGTGNGYYLRQIAAHFPNKIYHGVDVSAEFIAIAEREAGGGNVSFSHRNLFDVKEPYDFVLMRLLLQHLDDIQAVLDHVAVLTSPGESALIIDAHDPLRFFYPDLPEFTGFFAAYAEHERKAGRDRCVASRVEQAIASTAVWRAGGTLQLLIPSTIAGNLDLFTRTYTVLVDLVEQAGELQYDFPAVKEGWRRWLERPDAYTQVGLNLIRIDRV